MMNISNIQKKAHVNTQQYRVSIPTCKGKRLLKKQNKRHTEREEKKIQYKIHTRFQSTIYAVALTPAPSAKFKECQ